MDEKDRRILTYLIDRGRDKIADISRNLDIPRITVHERIQGMIARGTIKKFTVVPDYSEVGIPVVAFIFVSFRPAGKITQRDVAKSISLFREVEEVYIIAGQWDILVKIRAASNEDVGKFVLDKLRGVEGVERSETISVFSVVK